jgi:hypothetical protein
LLALLSFITSSTVSWRTAASTTANQNTEELEALHHAKSNQNIEQPAVFNVQKHITLIKKKIKFASYISKFEGERLQSHI